MFSGIRKRSLSVIASSASVPFTAILANFVAGLKYDHLDDRVIASARNRIIDQLGVQLIGSTLPWSKRIADFVRDYGSHATSSVVGHDFCVASYEAAFANATFGHSCELDDYIFPGGGGHPGVATVPVALALAEAGRCSGASVICAVVAGYEVMKRIGSVLHKGLGKRGYYSHGVVGVFAATATAAQMLGLDENQTLHALAIAGSFSSGTMEYDQTGGEAKRFHGGFVGRSGIQAALLAQRGLTGPTSMLEGARGIGRVFADYDGDYQPALQGLGQDWAITEAGIKIHPVLGRIAASLDAALSITHGRPIPAKEIASVDVAVTHGTLAHGGSIRKPKDVLSAQMSLPFALALQLVRATSDLSSFLDLSRLTDSEVLSVAAKVNMRADEQATGIRIFSANLTVRMTTGKELHVVQEFPKGSPLNPLTQDEVLEKFRKLAGSVLESDKIEQLIHRIGELEDMKDISSLMPLARH